MRMQPFPAGPDGGFRQRPATPGAFDALGCRWANGLAPQPDEDVGNRDLDRADLDAGITEAGGMRQVLRHVQPRYLGRQDLADRTGIDGVIGVAADAGIDGAMIHTGAAADT